ncbi:MAG: hypothetical protein CVV49_08775 [Spirochaetae bacterium HGW-Spirochaetae-5]|nr:MAG: hypothetical protein CVV49_08775 [Spirochaetae bacterium HGW-Spirochaetae-5]
MSKLKLAVFMLYSLIIAGAVFFVTNSYLADPHGAVITEKSPIVYNTVERDVYSMPLEDLQNDAQCLYTGFPGLDIVSVGNYNYMLSASLCERRWQKVVTIKARDSPRNIIAGGPFIDNRLNRGAWAQYYRLYGRIGLGGGVLLCRDYAVVQGGVALVW